MSSKPFPDVPGGYPFPELERQVLEYWRREKIFEKALSLPDDGGHHVFFEGPPTANNVPHIGHVVTRVVKDLFPRFKTMKGQHVARKAGWDTHGLPVEIEVEKRLGFSGKQQIEDYGIAAFNEACLESVGTYEKQWRTMTERVGYWIDLDDAYFTYSNTYVESVWWSLAELWRKGLLAEGYKIQPYCGRCGTTLSSHEVAQNYKDTEDPSIWVLFPARAGHELATIDGESWPSENLEMVAWTTTPWTLLAHVGLAVHAELAYRVIEDPRRPGKYLLFGDELGTAVPCVVRDEEGERQLLDLRGQPVLARFRGKDLENLHYSRPFEYFETEDGSAPWRVVLGDYVTASEGTGLVHTAPPFGEDDYKTGRLYDLPFFRSVDSEGCIVAAATPWAGQWFKDADPSIQRDLRERGCLLHSDRYHHNYPFCWRCDRPLLYYATESWFVTTTAKRNRLVELNKTIRWHPAHIGEGRFGNWLENVVDWALSRRRYWGTPLPVWQCDSCGEHTVIGSYAELFEAVGRELPDDPYDRSQFDPHRPHIDAFDWPCSSCGEGRQRRVEEVIDAWYDSGSMPFAQHHYPFENQELFAAQFPADFISEAVDQTRGWFYTLHVLGTLLFDSVAYRNCIVLGHVNDETGRKMSKRLGNVVEPMAVIEDSGADALRWYFYISNPEIPSRFSARLVREAAQGFLLPLWNALSFFTIYANLDGWTPGGNRPEHATRPALDRWILARLDRLTEETEAHLDAYRITDAARGIEAFIDAVTNWYIRRSRDRFWAPHSDTGEGTEKESAYQALFEILHTLALLLAPFTPFVADVLHRHLVRHHDDDAAESVHLESWPEPRGRRDVGLEKAMADVQRIVRLGHAARNTHSLKTRQPLAAVTVVAADPSLPERVGPYLDLICDELNVQEVLWARDRKEYVRHEIHPIFRSLGPRLGKRMPMVKKALADADGDVLAEKLEAGEKIFVELADGVVELTSDEVEIRLVEREGIATQGDREVLVALETELTPELIAEGQAREVIHRLQTARKEAELDYADRIRVRYRADGELAAAIEAHKEGIGRETLAIEITATQDDADLTESTIDEFALFLAIEKVASMGA